MTSQPLAFGELLAGGVLLAAALTGASVRDVIAGQAGPLKGFDVGGGSGTSAASTATPSNVTGTGIYTKKNLRRTDQGVDFIGSGPVPALAAGTVTHVASGGDTGWPGGTLITYALDVPVQVGKTIYKYVYVAENILPQVHAGQRVKAGQTLGIARGSSPYTEQGFASDPNGTTYARTHGGYTEGQATQAGKDFLSWLGL